MERDTQQPADQEQGGLAQVDQSADGGEAEDQRAARHQRRRAVDRRRQRELRANVWRSVERYVGHGRFGRMCCLLSNAECPDFSGHSHALMTSVGTLSVDQVPERFWTGRCGSAVHSAIEPSYIEVFLLPSTSLRPNQATEAQ